jgi:AraC-like DNA-binding protein
MAGAMGLSQSVEAFTIMRVELVGAPDGPQDKNSGRAEARISVSLALPRSQRSAAGPRTCGVDCSVNHRARIRGGLPGWKANRVLAHIGASLPGRVPVNELARLTGLSTGHFSRAFKETFGVSAATVLRRLRIELAQGLMLSTELPLREIALRCGLYDQFHLSRLFRHIVGEAPSRWRRARGGTTARVDDRRV